MLTIGLMVAWLSVATISVIAMADYRLKQK